MIPGHIVEVGGIPIRLGTEDPRLLEIIRTRYSDFITTARPAAAFNLALTVGRGRPAKSDELRVTRLNGSWKMARGDFDAEWSPETGRGRIRQARRNPYSIDAVLRIIHTLVLARQGGFLLHAASAILDGSALIFSGVSGAGKSTIASYAPADAVLLTDEISYVRSGEGGYRAFGTPFAGELGRPGRSVSAPVRSLYLIEHGEKNAFRPIGPGEAAAALLRNILFFAQDAELVRLVFQTACDFAARVPVYRLRFVPDSSVWEMLR